MHMWLYKLFFYNLLVSSNDQHFNKEPIFMPFYDQILVIGEMAGLFYRHESRFITIFRFYSRTYFASKTLTAAMHYSVRTFFQKQKLNSGTRIEGLFYFENWFYFRFWIEFLFLTINKLFAYCRSLG